MSEILTPYLEINRVLRVLRYAFVCTSASKQQRTGENSTAACMISRDRAFGMTVKSLAGDEPGQAVSPNSILVTDQIYLPRFTHMHFLFCHENDTARS